MSRTWFDVVNTFPDTCRVVLWGPADVSVDAGANGGTASRTIKPGTYGWKLFIGGGTTGLPGSSARAATRISAVAASPMRDWADPMGLPVERI